MDVERGRLPLERGHVHRRGGRPPLFEGGFSEELPMPARLAQQEDENLSGSLLQSVAQTRNLVLFWRVCGI